MFWDWPNWHNQQKQPQTEEPPVVALAALPSPERQECGPRQSRTSQPGGSGIPHATATTSSMRATLAATAAAHKTYPRSPRSGLMDHGLPQAHSPKAIPM